MTGGAGKRQLLGRMLAGGAYAVTGMAIAGLVAGHLLLRDVLPDLPPAPDPAALEVSRVVVDGEGELLRPFTTANGRWRLPVTLADVDARFIDMLLAYEDRHFREHAGIDWPATAARRSGSASSLF